ncbi:MAG: acetate/propionate family kinase [Alphaproteobacteria bacterium]|nr:acetate/propionate family kinase [Alphaproteobacteria bacterium]
MDRRILVLNGGSSTLKTALYLADDLSCVKRETHEVTPETYHEALESILSTIGPLHAIGHRVVHGGRRFFEPVRVDAEIFKALEDLIPLAPLHQPYNLRAISEIGKMHPDLTQIACFDTAFHRTQPEINQMYALPRSLTEQGIIRYGFHGLSYEHIADILPEHSGKGHGRVIVLHLGSGASACAMKDLKSISSTMGFTALEGLMMGTRCGAIDPGVILYLLQEKGLTGEEISTILYKKSGLLGVSGLSADSRDLIDNTDPDAQKSIDLFCHYARRAVGQLTAELGGLDVLVFTAGIGEHQPIIRAKIAEAFSWLGVHIDQDQNIKNSTLISAQNSAVEVFVLPTDEEAVIARYTREFI